MYITPYNTYLTKLTNFISSHLISSIYPYLLQTFKLSKYEIKSDQIKPDLVKQASKQ